MQENQLEGLITDNDKTNINQADINDLQRVKKQLALHCCYKIQIGWQVEPTKFIICLSWAFP